MSASRCPNCVKIVASNPGKWYKARRGSKVRFVPWA